MMAQSPTSQHRAQLIREMARDLNRTRHSSTSSKASNGNAEFTTSSFDPDNDALVSTQRIDNNDMSQVLPELRASAQKYRRWTRPEPEYVIDTSALGRAFPDFTQGDASIDGGSTDMSIEIGRGVPDTRKESNEKLGRSKEFSSNMGDSMDFSPAMIGNYQAISPPGHRVSSSATKPSENARGSLRRDAQVRRASETQKVAVEPAQHKAAKAKDYGSAESRQGSAEHHRSQAAMHARIDDVSQISEERPPTLNLTARSTRFSSGQRNQAPVTDILPSKFASTKGFFQALSQGTTLKQPVERLQPNNGTLSSVNPGTSQSFMLPDMPNLSDLVAGAFQDGTPVFSRHGKSRSSRFSSGSQLQQDGKRERKLPHVAAISVPEEEQDIYVSLKLLQDKVEDLEKDKAECEVFIDDLQEKNRLLEHEKMEQRRLRRSDSALGTTDGSDAGDESHRPSRKWSVEKSRLEATVSALQSQLKSANHKSSVSEVAVKNLTQERDSIFAQLGVAYVTTEQLKVDNERLVEENEQLKSEIRLLRSDCTGEIERVEGAKEEVQNRVFKEVKASREPKEPLHDVFEFRKAEDVRGGSEHQRKSSAYNKVAMANQRPKHQDQSKRAIAEEDVQSGNREIAQIRPQKVRNVTKEHYAEKRKPSPPGKNKDEVYESSEGGSSDESLNAYEANTNTGRKPMRSATDHSGRVANTTEGGDTTSVSFFGEGEVAKLRRTIEQERLASKQRQQPERLGREDGAAEVTKMGNVTTNSHAKESNLPRKSSVKDLTERSAKSEMTGRLQREAELTTQSRASTHQHRRHSEDSLLEQRNRRRGIGMEDMTSAFIIPDITMRNPLDPTHDLSPATQHVFNGLAKHDAQNCTVCKRVIGSGTTHDHDEPTKNAVSVPKPVPVSERMPQSAPYEEEPTIRPSQSPAVALAIVIKGLEDEVKHAKTSLIQYQRLYNQQDPSLGKRKRQAVLEAMRRLTKDIEVKSDQIYALYDVLEGQKQDGREMSIEEVEHTVRSIVEDADTMGLRGGDIPAKDSKKAEHNVWDLESELESQGDLPWEGIETTFDLTTRDVTQETSRRKSWGA